MNRFLGAGLALTLCLVAARGQTPAIQQRTQTVLYLQKLQDTTGGFRADAKATKPSLRATTAAARALGYLGGELPRKDACQDFVASCFDKASGGFADTPGGKPGAISTAIGLMAVAVLKMPAEPYREPARKYLVANVKDFEALRLAAAGLESIGDKSPPVRAWDLLLEEEGRKKLRQDDAAREVASLAVTHLRMGSKPTWRRDELVTLLRKDQRDDGGWARPGAKGSDLETSYRVMRALHMLKARPNAEKLRGLLDRCRNKDGGYGVAPGESSAVGPTYFAAIIQHWLKE
jgi:hypothetical protein